MGEEGEDGVWSNFCCRAAVMAKMGCQSILVGWYGRIGLVVWSWRVVGADNSDRYWGLVLVTANKRSVSVAWDDSE